jgi:hypothetical protein
MDAEYESGLLKTASSRSSKAVKLRKACGLRGTVSAVAASASGEFSSFGELELVGWTFVISWTIRDSPSRRIVIFLRSNIK